jgi:hypothetical protein
MKLAALALTAGVVFTAGPAETAKWAKVIAQAGVTAD